jgi:cytochrome P450
MDRGRPAHLSFGRGRHACLGVGLATRMMRAVVDTLVELPLDRVPPLTAEWQADLGMRMATRLVRNRAVAGVDH